MFKINLNEQCSVVLTQAGADILNRRSEEIEKQYQTKLFPRHNAGEIYKTQLWGLFDTFGEHISPSLETPFSGLTINFFKEEDKAE